MNSAWLRKPCPDVGAVFDVAAGAHGEDEPGGNAVRHSGGTGLTVRVAVADELAIDITDNGNGIPVDNRRHSGLANIR